MQRRLIDWVAFQKGENQKKSGSFCGAIPSLLLTLPSVSLCASLSLSLSVSLFYLLTKKAKASHDKFQNTHQHIWCQRVSSSCRPLVCLPLARI